MGDRVAGGRRTLGSFVPIVATLRSYERGWLRGDLVAGLTVAALIVPKNLGYAGIAGIPLQNGLYAAAAGALLYAVFGTSRQISMGPSSGTLNLSSPRRTCEPRPSPSTRRAARARSSRPEPVLSRPRAE